MAGLRKGLGLRLRTLRKAANLTQNRLATLADIDPKFLGTLERGEKGASLEVLERIIGALRVEPYELFLFSLADQGKKTPRSSEDVLRSILTRTDESTRTFLIGLNHSLLTWLQSKKI